MIKLEPFSKENIDTLKSWITNKDLLFQWTGDTFKWPLDEAQLEQYAARIGGSDPGLASFNVIDAETEELVGHVDIDEINLPNKRGEITRVIVKEGLRNKGYGKELMRAVVDYGFNALKLHRLTLKVFDFNKQAIECYKKIGFVHEGTLRDVLFHEGKYWSVHLMSVLSNEGLR